MTDASRDAKEQAASQDRRYLTLGEWIVWRRAHHLSLAHAARKLIADLEAGAQAMDERESSGASIQ